MATCINTLAEYVYKKFMEEEVAKAERGSNGENEVLLYGIKSVDKLPCEVIVGVNYRKYYLKIMSKHLIETNGYDYCDKVYYCKDIMSYDATKIHQQELDKEAGLGQRYRLKIIKKEDVDKFMDLVINTLKELKFNTFMGKLSKNDIPHNIFDCLKSPNVEIEEGEECVVCYERTLNKTFCKHSLCFKCMENIQTRKSYCDIGICKSCPMCRKNILDFRDFDDDDE